MISCFNGSLINDTKISYYENLEETKNNIFDELKDILIGISDDSKELRDLIKKYNELVSVVREYYNDNTYNYMDMDKLITAIGIDEL